MASWQPIETAPRDGTIILLWDGAFVAPGCWRPDVHGEDYPWAFVDQFTADDNDPRDGQIVCNGWRENGVYNWMPLPEPPDS